MLGSAISRRPLVLFALVGLVGLMMALWSTPVSADSDGWDLRVAPGSVTSLSPGSISSGADGASSSSAEATYEWSVTGSCGSFDSTSAQNVLFTAADGTCSGVLSVSVSRAGSDTVNSSVTLHVLGSGEAIVEEVVEEEAEVEQEVEVEEEAPVVVLPATGGYAPSALVLFLSMLIGSSLLIASALTVRGMRRSA